MGFMLPVYSRLKTHQYSKATVGLSELGSLPGVKEG